LLEKNANETIKIMDITSKATKTIET